MMKKKKEDEIKVLSGIPLPVRTRKPKICNKVYPLDTMDLN